MKSLIESSLSIAEAVQFLLEDYDYCSLQANLPVPMFGKTWQEIDEEDLYEEEGKHYGLETEPHITVLYGLLKDNPEKVSEVVKGFGDFEIELTKRSLFENEKYDVLKYGIKSPHLHELNKLIRLTFPYETNYPDYNPHCTIAYLKVGTGKKYLGKDSLVGKKFQVKTLLFSSRDRSKTPIKL